MNKISLNQKNRINKNGKSFSFKSMSRFFLKGNITLALMIAIIIINIGDWRTDGRGNLMVFIVFYEVVLILFSFLSGFKPELDEMKISKANKDLKREWTGFIVAILITSLFSILFLPEEIPFPSNMLFLILAINFGAGVFSVIAHPIAIRLYDMNVHETKNSVLDYTFKYIAIFYSSMNHYVQLTLQRLPLPLNKLFAIAFVAFMFIAIIIFGTIFTS